MNPETRRYLGGACERWEQVSTEDSRFEALFLGLRTTDGVQRAAFARRFGDDPAQRYASGLGPLSHAGLQTEGERSIAPTAAPAMKAVMIRPICW